jgi:hypothetical protein
MSGFVRWLVLAVLVAAVFFVTYARAEEEVTPDSTRYGIMENMQANMAACNAEDMDALMACMSEEIPNKERFKDTVDQMWDVTDTYNTVLDVEVVQDSESRWARYDYPYATARITQRTYHAQVSDAARSVFGQCRANGGQCGEKDLARLMGLTSRDETIQFDALFKHEDGKWKLIANISRPKTLAENGVDRPKQSSQKAGRSVF